MGPNDEKSPMMQLLEIDQAATALFREEMKKIPQVEGVHVVPRDDGVLDLWIVIPENNYDVKKRIIEAQCLLMRVFQSVQFDFLILVRQDRTISEILPKETLDLYAA